jgi:quercetin dioxygenase-like cupin family protein
MTMGVMLEPGEGEKIQGGGLDVSVKVTDPPAFASTFEVVVPPGFDVGAHVHGHGQEVFFVIEGELDVLAFEPTDRSLPDWHEWESRSGQRYLHGSPGAFMFVPENTPHAFANTTDRPARMFFQSSVPGGHENYFRELAELLRHSSGRPDAKEVASLRRRYDIEQLTALSNGSQRRAPAGDRHTHTAEHTTTHTAHGHDH